MIRFVFEIVSVFLKWKKRFFEFFVSSVVVVVTGHLPMDGDMAEDHGVAVAGKLSRAWARGRKETKNCKRASGAKSP